MYNPELAFQREQSLINNQELLDKVERRLGSNHSWTQRVSLITDILHHRAQKEQDLDNCFMDCERAKVEKEINNLTKIGLEVLNKK